MDVGLTRGISTADIDNRGTPMNWTHGTNGLLTLSCVGVLLGLMVGRTPASRPLASPLVALLLGTAMAGPIKATAIARNLIPYLGLIFIGIFSGLAGKLFANLAENRNHKRGSAGRDPGVISLLRCPKSDRALSCNVTQD